jgi:Domain of unknown function (DUF4926)
VSVSVIRTAGLSQVRNSVPGEWLKTYQTLDAIVLERDMPDHGMRKGDLGAVVAVYEPEGLEVELVTPSGRTGTLVTLNARDVCPVADDDLVSVRPSRRSA